MKKWFPALVLILGLIISLPAYAQDTYPQEDQEDAHILLDETIDHSEVKTDSRLRYEDSKLDLGIALGYSFPFAAILDLSLQYRFNSFYRMGIEDKFGGMILYFQNMITWTHEFDAYRGPVFSFSVRLGVGWGVYFGGLMNIFQEHSSSKDPVQINVLTFPTGLAFNWRLNQRVSLRLLVDVNNNVYFFEGTENSDTDPDNPDKNKKTTDVQYMPLPDLIFGVLIHI